jgi:hypothetical protein
VEQSRSRFFAHRRKFLRTLASAGVGGSLVAQQLPDLYHSEAYGDPPFLSESGWRPLLNGRDLTGWKPVDTSHPNQWFTTRSVEWKRIFDPTHLTAKAEPGDRIVNGPGKTVNLVTEEKFGSFELYAEFLLAKGSNSGIYLHSEYEVQIFDSFGFEGQLMVGDCGGIYEDDRGTGGSPPRVNAARPPGQWQSLRIWFEAPKFDGSGRKTIPAKVNRVMLNGVPVQEQVEVPAPTRSHLEIPESATNPLMLQGDHSAVAYRNIFIKQFSA